MVERDFSKGHFFVILNCVLGENSYHCIYEKNTFLWISYTGKSKVLTICPR